MRTGRPPKDIHNPRRTVSLSPRHDKLLSSLAAKLDTTKTGTIERALEALEEKEARRDKELTGGKVHYYGDASPSVWEKKEGKG